MLKKLSPKQSFLLMCLSTVAFIVGVQLYSMVRRMGDVDWVPDSLWDWFLWFLWPFGIPVILIVIFFVVVVIPKAQIALSRLEIPEKYSPKHFLLLLWLTAGAFLLGVALHGAIYALGIVAFGAGFWGGSDEPVFFTIAIFVVPAGVIVGAMGRVWEWAVTQPIEMMKAKGVQLPTAWPYFAPFGSYGWLWKFGRGVEAITDRRMRAAGVFALVFFLGIIGLIISRAITRHRLDRVAV
ncbi:hypothetical protein ACFLUH_03825 [Chloroflexota bacterium]